MSVTQTIARRIAGKARIKENGVGIDPLALIALIAAILEQAIGLYKSCHKTPEQAAADANALNMGALNWFKRRKLWVLVKRANLPVEDPAEVYEEILNVGELIGVVEMSALYRGD